MRSTKVIHEADYQELRQNIRQDMQDLELLLRSNDSFHDIQLNGEVSHNDYLENKHFHSVFDDLNSFLYTHLTLKIESNIKKLSTLVKNCDIVE